MNFGQEYSLKKTSENWKRG